jgi:Ca2+-binding RTX toxin-like protein
MVSVARDAVVVLLVALAAATVLAPPAAHAATRPLNTMIVEPGDPSGAARTTLFVHGTNGANRVVVDFRNGKFVIRNLTGERMLAGKGCAADQRRFTVTCGRSVNQGQFGFVGLERVSVHLWSANDTALVTYGARNVPVEVWGGTGRDSLKVEASNLLFRKTLLGGNDDDLLIGSQGPESLWGGPGNDVIRPGGGADNIDGGHGFRTGGEPVSPAECAARTHGFFDRKLDQVPNGAEGYDTLDLSTLEPSYLRGGVLADLNVCRLGYFGYNEIAQVFAMERVYGTRLNDRLVGDEDSNRLFGLAGRDWMSGEGGRDFLDSRDGEVDTVRCGDVEDEYVMDANENRLGC